jgi:high-affinity K+ transport system ATPase subunit B
MDFRGDMERNRNKAIGKNVNRSKTRQQKISAQAHYSEINRKVKTSIRKGKRNWINEQAKQAEDAERKGDIKELHNISKEVVSEKV